MVNLSTIKEEVMSTFKFSEHDAAAITLDTYWSIVENSGNILLTAAIVDQDDLKREVFQYAQRLQND